VATPRVHIGDLDTLDQPGAFFRADLRGHSDVQLPGPARDFDASAAEVHV
jgi:hypothetical protein